MKIFETEDDGKIGDLLYKTVKFTRQELVAGGVGVISQSAVLRYLEAAKPDLKIKKCGSFKLDSQVDTVTMRIGIADTKLLNPGYDELKVKHDVLLETCLSRRGTIIMLEKKYGELQHEKDIVGRLYDALVIAVAKDAQKFLILLVENEELKKQNIALAKCAGIDISPEAPDVQIGVKGDENQRPTEKVIDEMLEDSADLADAKNKPSVTEFMKGGGSQLPEVTESERSDTIQ